MDANLRFERSSERIVAEHKFMPCEAYDARRTRCRRAGGELREPAKPEAGVPHRLGRAIKKIHLLRRFFYG